MNSNFFIPHQRELHILLNCLVFLLVTSPIFAIEKNREKAMDWIQVTQDKTGFKTVRSQQKFTPFGFNYDRDYKMRLLEEYWETEWQTVAADFQEMKALGANVVRIHLQFGKFMESPQKPNKRALRNLKKLLSLAEKSRLYLNLTGLAYYRKQEVPAWFDALSENDRWTAQAEFWRAIAQTCAKSPAVFCYDLINEPVVPGGKSKEWYFGHLAGFDYCQRITLDPAGRDRATIASQWIRQMSKAIRQHDKRHLITVGLLPNSATKPISGSGFPPDEIVSDLDFISVHIYPESGKIKEDLQLLKGYSVGKPVVIEEMFPMKCRPEELREFVLQSRKSGNAQGWIGFYWGQTLQDLKTPASIGEHMTRAWLELFQDLQPAIFESSGGD